MKYFRMTFEEAVHRRSWLNIIMLFSCIPNYKSTASTDEGKRETPKRMHISQFLQGEY